jgi:hypothetical protein
MTITTLYIGLNDKDTKKQEVNTTEAIKLLTNMLADIGGATIYEATGIYTHENGDIIIENTLRVELIGIEENIILNKIKVLKLLFNQESIIKQTEEINTSIL